MPKPKHEIPLTPAQERIVERMARGERLISCYPGYGQSYWTLGGELINRQAPDRMKWDANCQPYLIAKSDTDWFSDYHLTERGQQAARERGWLNRSGSSNRL